MWRGDRRSGLSVAASCVWRCPSTLAVIPFPHPVHRTGLADLPHPALGQDITPARVTPSAVSEHWPELLGCPISAPSLASCVSPEPRSLPSTGITRLPQYYEPLRHPTAPGASLAGLRLRHPWATPWGFPCCVRFPCVHAAATTPAQRLGSYLAQSPSRINLPRKGYRVGLRIDIFEACSAFTHVAACTLALSPIRDMLYPEGFNRFVTSTVAYMDAARMGKYRVHVDSGVRRQSYIRPTCAELGSAWP